MNIEEFRDYCLAKKGVTEEFPFDEVTLVFKVVGKIFAITGLDNEQFEVNLKCEPEYALELREQHPEVRPGWHMNKKHWNTITLDDSIPDDEIFGMMDHSYNLVVKGLKKADQQKLHV